MPVLSNNDDHGSRVANCVESSKYDPSDGGSPNCVFTNADYHAPHVAYFVESFKDDSTDGGSPNCVSGVVKFERHSSPSPQSGSSTFPEQVGVVPGPVQGKRRQSCCAQLMHMPQAAASATAGYVFSGTRMLASALYDGCRGGVSALKYGVWWGGFASVHQTSRVTKDLWRYDGLKFKTSRALITQGQPSGSTARIFLCGPHSLFLLDMAWVIQEISKLSEKEPNKQVTVLMAESMQYILPEGSLGSNVVFKNINNKELKAAIAQGDNIVIFGGGKHEASFPPGRLAQETKQNNNILPTWHSKLFGWILDELVKGQRLTVHMVALGETFNLMALPPILGPLTRWSYAKSKLAGCPRWIRFFPIPNPYPSIRHVLCSRNRVSHQLYTIEQDAINRIVAVKMTFMQLARIARKIDQFSYCCGIVSAGSRGFASPAFAYMYALCVYAKEQRRPINMRLFHALIVTATMLKCKIPSRGINKLLLRLCLSPLSENYLLLHAAATTSSPVQAVKQKTE